MGGATGSRGSWEGTCYQLKYCKNPNANTAFSQLTDGREREKKEKRKSKATFRHWGPPPLRAECSGKAGTDGHR